jgi:hypothetical protein
MVLSGTKIKKRNECKRSKIDGLNKKEIYGYLCKHAPQYNICAKRKYEGTKI